LSTKKAKAKLMMLESRGRREFIESPKEWNESGSAGAEPFFL
jgi:hypothetical protein